MNNMKNSLIDVIKLLYCAFKKMPLLTVAWFTLPLIAGFTIILSSFAQIQLINDGTEIISNKNKVILLKEILTPAMIIALASVISLLANSLKKMVSLDFVQRFSLYIQTEIISKTLETPLEYFDDSTYADKLQRAKNASKENLFNIFNNIMYLLQYIINFVAILIIISRGNYLLPILVLIVAIPSLILALKVEIEVKSLNKDLTFEGRKADYLKGELLKTETIKEMRIFSSTNYLINNWRENSLKQNSLRYTARRKEITQGMLLNFMRNISVITSVYLLILGLQRGSVTPGIVAITFQKVAEAQVTCIRMPWSLSKIYMLSTKAKDIIDFLSIKIPSKGERKLSLSALKSISFNNVTFKYASSKLTVLNNLSFSIKAGETIALVGDNGAGKSTLVNLLLGMYEPSEGNITWGDKDYSMIKPEGLYRHISVVFQDFEHYQLSIRENVSLGVANNLQSDDKILRVLKECGISSIAENYEDLDTLLGQQREGGRELSGGQWQKLAIARAMYRDVELLILDEPTSALDPKAELDIFKQFKKLAEGKTTIFISHRLGWARYADRILLLDEGKLIEEGSHEELISLGGKYAKTFELQASWYS